MDIKFNTVYEGNAGSVLQTFPDQSVNCCITSPPYYGLRDYGTATWEGGDPDCEHVCGAQVQDNKAPGAIQTGVRPGCDASICKKCGAARIDAQIGLEKTPDEYVQNLVDVFREVRRVFRDDGTLWLNLGDSYATHASKGSAQFGGDITDGRNDVFTKKKPTAKSIGLKEKDLIGIPWMVAFALRADGWYLRQDIIWHKPNPMPESVTDRCTKSHEYIFLLSKSKNYYYDSEAIKENSIDPESLNGRRWRDLRQCDKTGDKLLKQNFHKCKGVIYEKRNKRSVWTVTTKPYKGAHFATFPEKLIEPAILAGCPEGGVVLDPFAGSGTTIVTAQKLNRNGVGCELNPDYIKLFNQRQHKEIGMFAHTS